MLIGDAAAPAAGQPELDELCQAPELLNHFLHAAEHHRQSLQTAAILDQRIRCLCLCRMRALAARSKAMHLL